MKKITIYLALFIFAFQSNAQVTDVPGAGLEIIEFIEDVVKWTQEYNHHQLEGADKMIDEQLTLEFKKMENVHRKINDILQNGKLNDIKKIIDRADKIRERLNHFADKFNLSELERLTNRSYDLTNSDLFKLGELNLSENYNMNSFEPLSKLRKDQSNFDQFSVHQQINEAIDLIQTANELKSKADEIDKNLGEFTFREFIVDGLAAKLMTGLNIQQEIDDLIESAITSCEGNEYALFIDAATNLAKAATDLKEAEIGDEELTDYVKVKATYQTGFDYYKSNYYDCRNNNNKDTKAKVQAIKNVVKELVDIMLFLLGIDIQQAFPGINQVVEEPLLRMNDAERMDVMLLRNEQITESMEAINQAVSLLNEAAQSTPVSVENMERQKQILFTNYLTELK